MTKNINIFPVKNKWLHNITDNYEGISFVHYRRYHKQNHNFLFFGATADGKPTAFASCLYFVAESGVAGWYLSASFSRESTVRDLIMICSCFIVDFLGEHMPIYVLINRQHSDRKKFRRFAEYFGFHYHNHYDNEFDIYIRGKFYLEGVNNEV